MFQIACHYNRWMSYINVHFFIYIQTFLLGYYKLLFRKRRTFSYRCYSDLSIKNISTVKSSPYNIANDKSAKRRCRQGRRKKNANRKRVPFCVSQYVLMIVAEPHWNWIECEISSFLLNFPLSRFCRCWIYFSYQKQCLNDAWRQA